MELGKIPPHDIEAEQAVLGCMLTDKDSVISAVEILKEDDFYNEIVKKFRSRYNVVKSNDGAQINNRKK